MYRVPLASNTAAGSKRLFGIPCPSSLLSIWVEVQVVEGRKHQVRLMLESVGHPVLKLRRIRYDGLELGDLPLGACRSLTRTEIERLRQAVPDAGRPKARRSS